MQKRSPAIAKKAYVRSPASEFQSRRERFFRGDTVPCTLC